MEKPLSNNVDLVLALATSCADSERIERKYAVGYGQQFWIRPHLARAGFFTHHADRVINSIYFDTNDFSCARANIDGLQYRLKFRLRYYNEDISSAVLEVKIKTGFLGYKKVISTVELDASESLDDKIQVAIEYFSKMINEPVMPAANISYHRSYLLNSRDVRATIDNKIIGGKYLNLKNKISRFANYEVMEFKYKALLDQEFRELTHPFLADLNVRMTKCSKYVKAVS